jgi:peroxiredoxin
MGPGATSGAGATHPLLGAAAPPFELASPDGKQKLRLSDYAGKVVLIDFWATWCVPCRKSFPAYQHIADQFGSKLAVIGISVDNEAAGVAEFAKAHGGKFPVLWDDGQITSHSYQLDTMPATFIVDASGVVRFAHFQSGEEHAIESEIRSLLQ